MKGAVLCESSHSSLLVEMTGLVGGLEAGAGGWRRRK